MNRLRDPFAEQALGILVVGDRDASPSGLSWMVAALGHRALQARSGDEAVAQARAYMPDAILMAFPAPEDGMRISARIRALQEHGTPPVIHAVPREADARVLGAIQAGGDDYLPAPVSADLLGSKLRDCARIRALQRENAAQKSELERYFNEVEEEQHTASGLMCRLVQMDGICDPAIKYRFTPAQFLSGDVIAAARTPGNCLQVLVADGTGHGLAASLGVMPVVQPFYAMTQKGFGLATIAKEINRKVREWLPVGRFIAASLIEVDPHARMVSVWNGGNPPLLLIGEDGNELYRFVSRQLPLGIVCSRDMELSVDRFTLEGSAQLIACSDGVVEAMSPDGAPFGIDRLIAVAAAAARADRLQSINAALDAHLAGRKPHDDLSLVVVDCDASAIRKQGAADAATSGAMRVLRNWRFDIELSPNELRQTDVVPLVLNTLERMNLPPLHRSNLFVVLSELVNNALDHGVLLLDSRLKVDDMERYLRLREKLLSALTEGWIRIGLRMIERDDEACLRIHIRDSGDGFDWRRQCAPSQHAQLHGRGLALVRRLCASVDYRDPGNEVIAIYEFAPA